MTVKILYRNRPHFSRAKHQRLHFSPPFRQRNTYSLFNNNEKSRVIRCCPAELSCGFSPWRDLKALSCSPLLTFRTAPVQSENDLDLAGDKTQDVGRHLPNLLNHGLPVEALSGQNCLPPWLRSKPPQTINQQKATIGPLFADGKQSPNSR
jgi:hypothetical protein